MENTTVTAQGRFYIYTRYERFWHWLQAALIIGLLLTGLEVHGSFTLFGFRRAVILHSALGATWLVAFVFFVFWLATTGEWQQYVPTTKKMFEVMRYYAYGIFMGRPHPCPKSPEVKHNPLQRLTYLSLTTLLLPFMMITGLLYYGYHQWPALGLGFLSLSLVAAFHLAGAFAVLVFLVVHVYMATTGHSPLTYFKAMITGWEDTGEAPRADWEKRSACN